MNWKHHQQMKEDVEDEEFLGGDSIEEGCEQNDDNQIDPLDLFMDNLNQEQSKQSKQQNTSNLQFKSKNKQNNEHKNRQLVQQQKFNQYESQPDYENELIQKDREQDDEILSNEDFHDQQHKKQKKNIEMLKPFDFSNVQLKDFQKDFYQQHEQISALSQQQVKKLLKQFEIKVTGTDIPKPIISFGHLPFDQRLKKLIVKNQFQKPTPIQAIALPAALSGRDIVGIAKTGSGKTLAYVWPMIIHVGHQEQSEKNDGPIAIVMAPTRELCQQIYIETKKYTKKYDIKVACILGGQNKHQQWKNLKAGVDILIASPGRLIEMLKKKATNLIRVTYLVLDEADRMLSLGFEQQIRSIVSQTREDRQTLLFTATMKQSMQFLVNDIINSPIRINIGEEGAANEDVKQSVVILKQKQQKLNWLFLHIRGLLAEGKVLIFANQRDTCEEIGIYFKQQIKINALVLHGDKNQYDRTMIMNSFKNQESILIATDIAARGIDVKNIKTVINFECPKQIEGYIHRIGRAGRAGVTGEAYTFLTNNDIKFAILLVKTFENSGYPVSQELEDLACLDDMFRRKRLSSKMGVSFAKGKDASKFLNQVIKKQRNGFSRAGLGLDDGQRKPYRTEEVNMISQELKNKDMSITELSNFIRQRNEKQKANQKYGRFVLASIDEKKEKYFEPTITFFKGAKKQ